MNDLRVFISSTFRDLQEEREHLVRKIFPEIRAICRERGITFTEVDLRWGLTDEDVVRGQVIRACLEEIDKCRPYFIGITGDRYGYVPDVVDIYKDVDLLSTYPWIEDAATDGSSIIDLEFRHGALNDGNDRARFFFRNETGVARQDVSSYEHERLQELKRRVCAAGSAVQEFSDPSTLGVAVRGALMEILDRDFTGDTPPSELERERASHAAFAASRRRAYIPNPAYLASLNSWFSDASTTPLILYAESGSGKSSLVSFWCEQLRRRVPDAFVVEHYVGIGAGDVDHLGIMRHVMCEIKERFARVEEVPARPEELALQFSNWLGFAVGEPMLLVLDGMNQLVGHALELHWLPPVMPPGVKLLVTTTVEETLVDLRRRAWRELAMQPLTEREREGVVVRYLAEYRKSLSKEQVARISGSEKCAHPLFLRTLLEELRIDSSHEKLDERIALYLGTSGTEDLFQRVLERMENDFGAHTVRDIMSLIWCSRFGVDEEDMQTLVGIPTLQVSTILSGLDYHLVRHERLRTFFHDYLRRAVGKRYLADERLRLETWQKLASHFVAQPVTLHSTRELVHAYVQLGLKERALETIAETERFDLMYRDQTQHEVHVLWSGVDATTIARMMLQPLRIWQTSAAADRQLELLGRVSDLLSSVGCVSDALAIEEERLSLAIETGDLIAQGRALNSQSDKLRVLGDTTRAAECAAGAESIARSIGDLPGVAAALANRGLIHATSGDVARALECYEEQESIARAIGDQTRILLAVLRRGIVHYEHGEFGSALECFAECEASYRAMGNRRGAASAVGNSGHVHLSRGDYDRALRCYTEQESIQRDLGDRPGTAYSVGNRGLVHSYLGEYDRAVECFKEQEAIGRSTGDRRAVTSALGNRASVLWRCGDYEQALSCYAEQEALADAMGDRRVLAFAVGNSGLAYAALGDYEQALVRLTQQRAIAEEIGDRASMAYAVGNFGFVLSERGDHDRALECFAEQETMAASLGDRGSVALAVSNSGYLHLEKEDYEQALESLALAESIRRDIGDRPQLAQTLTYLSRVFLECPGPGDMPPYLAANLSGTEDWRAGCADRSRRIAEEAVALAQEVGDEGTATAADVVLARLDAAEAHDARARERLQRALETAKLNESRAELHFWMWRLMLDPDVDHQALADQLFSDLWSRVPKYSFKKRLEELHASVGNAVGMMKG